MLVEPSRMFGELQRNRGAHNYVSNDVVCEHNGTVRWMDEMKDTKWSAVSGIDEVSKVRPQQSRPKISERACTPLRHLLGQAGLRHIDFFSLDVQGSELSVLKTMDWNIPVAVIMVEMDGVDGGKDQAVRELLRAQRFHFYQRMGFGPNELWTRFPHTCGAHTQAKGLAGDTPNCTAQDGPRRHGRERSGSTSLTNRSSR